MGFGVWGLGFGVWGLGSGVWGLVLRVSGNLGRYRLNRQVGEGGCFLKPDPFITEPELHENEARPTLGPGKGIGFARSEGSGSGYGGVFGDLG